MNPVFRFTRLLLLPAPCLSCERDLPPQRPIPVCAACVRTIRAPGPERARKPLDGFIAAATFKGTARDLVLGLKYAKKTYLARVMGGNLSRSARRWRREVEVIVPVPLPALRRLARGFNPTERIAFDLSRRWQIPVETNALRRRWGFPSQTSLGRVKRLENARKSFALGRRALSVSGRSVLLIDDVCTSGGTLSACAALLKKAGAAQVRAAVFAREPLGIKGS